MNLQEQESDSFATILGHDISIHHEFYRLPDNVLMVAKYGKILVAMEQGLGDFSGKTLDNIEIKMSGNIDDFIGPTQTKCFKNLVTYWALRFL